MQGILPARRCKVVVCLPTPNLDIWLPCGQRFRGALKWEQYMPELMRRGRSVALQGHNFGWLCWYWLGWGRLPHRWWLSLICLWTPISMHYLCYEHQRWPSVTGCPPTTLTDYYCSAKGARAYAVRWKRWLAVIEHFHVILAQHDEFKAIGKGDKQQLRPWRVGC